MINHKTSDEFRREIKIYRFVNFTDPRAAEENVHDYIEKILDAYESCEKQLKALESLIKGRNE